MPDTPPSPPAPPSITELLRAAQHGDSAAHDSVARLVYEELRQLAALYLGRERDDHTLQPTALVNEAFLRLMGQETSWRSRAHFFGIAAQMMRRVLVDHARRSAADRRDRGSTVRLDDVGPLAREEALDADTVLDVHAALEELERMDPRQAKVVELKFFVGLPIDEVARVLDIAPITASREWALARKWLQHRLQQE